jgi:hypothetical protein
MDRLTVRSAKTWVVSITVLLLTAALVAFAEIRSSTDEDSVANRGLSARPDVARGFAEEAGSDTPSRCLAPGVSDSQRSALVAEAQTAADKGSPTEFTSGVAEVTAQEANALVRFDARFPETPPGWTATTVIRPTTPNQPFDACSVDTAIRDPSEVETVTFPEVSGVNDQGKPYTLPEETITIHKGAQVSVFPIEGPFQPVGDAGVEGTTSKTVTIQGYEAQVFTRDYDEPSIFIGWQDTSGGVQIHVGCSLLTVDECMAIAETIK